MFGIGLSGIGMSAALKAGGGVVVTSTAALADALASSTSAIFIKAGTYDFTTWVPPTVRRDLRIVAEDGVVLVGPTTYTNFISSTHSLYIKGSFQHWDKVVDYPASEVYDAAYCTLLITTRDVTQALNAEITLGQSGGDLVLGDGRIRNVKILPGCDLEARPLVGSTTRATVKVQCKFDTIEADDIIMSGGYVGLFAGGELNDIVGLSDPDQFVPEWGAVYARNVTASGMSRTDAGECHAIDTRHNMYTFIDDIDISDLSSTFAECEGVYSKSAVLEIGTGSIHNATNSNDGSEGSVCVKIGTPHFLGGLTISSDKGVNAGRGIWWATEEDIDIQGVTLSGMREDIVQHWDTYNQNIEISATSIGGRDGLVLQGRWDSCTADMDMTGTGQGQFGVFVLNRTLTLTGRSGTLTLPNLDVSGYARAVNIFRPSDRGVADVAISDIDIASTPNFFTVGGGVILDTLSVLNGVATGLTSQVVQNSPSSITSVTVSGVIGMTDVP